MHFSTQNHTKTEPKRRWKTLKKSMKKSWKKSLKKGGQIDRKMKPKAAPRRPNNPTSCRQNPDTKPGTARDAKKTRKRSQNGGKMKQKGNPMGAQIRRNCFKNGAIRLQGYAKPREDAASRGNTAQDAAQSREKPHRDAGRRRETWKYAAGSRTETREDAERHRKTPKDAERGRETRKDAETRGQTTERRG